MSRPPRLCAVPVSWPSGLGELARQLTILDAARRRWPELSGHLVLNRHLPAAARALVPNWCEVSWLDTSPTHDDAGVMAALDRCEPDLVLFDNAGTGRQCRHARRLGARTVFLSTRPQTLARGFGASWLPWLEEHWVVGPRALAEPLPVEWRLVAAAYGIEVRTVQALYASDDAARAVAARDSVGCVDPYVCFLPGGGGGQIADETAVATYAAAAERVARRTGVGCVLLVGPLHAGPAPDAPGVVIRRATHAQAVDLMAGAHLVVLGASSSLFQALAQRRVCVTSTSGGSEQLERARAWAARGAVAAAEPTPAALADETCALLADRPRWTALRRHVEELAVENDLPVALQAIASLLGR